MGNALDLGARVTHGVEGFFGARKMAVSGDAAAAWLAEIDVAGQLADDEDVQAGDQLALQAGGIYQLRIADRRAEIGEQAEVFAQAQNGLLGAQRAIELVVFPVAHRAEQHGVGVLGQLERGVGQRVAVRLVGCAADQCGFGFKFQVENFQNLDGFDE